MKIKDSLKIKKRLIKTCSCCGKEIKVVVYSKNNYRGGHYFGKVPFHTEKEYEKAAKAGFTPWRVGKSTLYVFKKDPKPYKKVEYWECPKCYWGY